MVSDTMHAGSARSGDQRAAGSSNIARTGAWVTSAGLVGMALTHLLDLPEKLEEAPTWEAVASVLIAVASLALIVPILRAADRTAHLAAATVAALTLLAYIVSRGFGLPADSGTVGEWSEPLGVLSIISELAVIVGAMLAVRVRR